jgi:hypothetical protein
MPTAQTAKAQTAKDKKPGFFGRIFGGAQEQGIDVVSAAFAKDGSAVIMTKDGTVWRQADLQDVGRLPKPGEKMTIDDGVFGKHLCQYGPSPLFDCRPQPQ